MEAMMEQCARLALWCWNTPLIGTDITSIPITPLHVIIVLFLLFLFWYSISFMTLEHISGPIAVPFFGNLLRAGALLTQPHTGCFGQYAQRYGKVFRVYLGRRPIVVVCDADTMTDIMITRFSSTFKNRFRSPGIQLTDGLLWARDNAWKRLRRTISPTFNVIHLKQIALDVNDAADVFLKLLDKVEATDVPETDNGASETSSGGGAAVPSANSAYTGEKATGTGASTSWLSSLHSFLYQLNGGGGEREGLLWFPLQFLLSGSGIGADAGGGAEELHRGADSVELHERISRLTLQIIGSAGFGTTLDSQENPDDPVVTASRELFRLFNRSVWLVVALLMPPSWSDFVATMPSSVKRRQNRAIAVVKDEVSSIITTRRQERKEQQQSDDPTPNNDTGKQESEVDQSFGRAGGGAGLRGGEDGDGDEVNEPVSPERLERKRGRDLLQLMLASRDRVTGKELLDTEIGDNCFTFLLAGHETTSNALAYTIYLLAKHPEVERKVLAELDRELGLVEVADSGDSNTNDHLAYDDVKKLTYLNMVFQEAMRLFPPAPITTREASEDTHIGKHFIPAGTIVVVPIFHFHHNEELWDEPEEFRPERFTPDQIKARHPAAYMPFGLGPRGCVGARFATMEALIILARVLRRFRFSLSTAHHPPGQSLPLHVGITMSPRDGIHVHVHHRRGEIAT